MTLEQFLANWPGATPAVRFNAFVLWVTNRIAGYPRWVSPSFQMVNGGLSGNCDPGYQIPAAMFQDGEPTEPVVSLGHAIIQQCSNVAKAKYEKAYKDAKKERDKQIEKWLDKMQKELMKDMAKAYAEMAKYYAKKYEMEKGS